MSTIEGRRQALLAGLGVATMPYPLVEEDITADRLRVVSPESTSEIDIIMAWRHDSMGEAKSWCLQEISRLSAGKQLDYYAEYGAKHLIRPGRRNMLQA